MSDPVIVTVPDGDKNHDLTATLIGMFQAIAVSVVDFMTHSSSDGIDWKAPTFWIGLAIAALAGLQGYYSNKGTGSKVVAAAAGKDAQVNVSVQTDPQPVKADNPS